ncbi:hypothetical protein K3495_g10463 [Podosphaera aphanis]|nr:hypothetical protein K3495_g10463 [Podosphaera aphanis]
MGEYTNNGKENEKKQRSRFMGKLFKETKKPTSEVEVDNFLHGTTGRLFMVPANLSQIPSLAHIDTSAAPHTMTVENKASPEIDPTRSLKRSRRGLVVRFSDAKPELIGEGGDLAESPTASISFRKLAKENTSLHHNEDSLVTNRIDDKSRPGNFEPLDTPNFSHSGHLGRTHTVHEPNTQQRTEFMVNHDLEENITSQMPTRSFSDRRDLSDRRSFSQKVKDEMRSGEGRILVASRNSVVQGDLPECIGLKEIASSLEELHLNTMSNAIRSGSARPLTPDEHLIFDHLNDIPDTKTGKLTHQGSPPKNYQTERPLTASKTSSMPEVLTATNEEALKEFSKRTSNLSILFQSSADAAKLTSACPLELLIRTGIWWFLKGRMNLETAVRDRFASNQSQNPNFLSLDQAYMDLAKSLWIMEISASKSKEIELYSVAGDSIVDTLDARQAVISGLRKLTISMKRNNFLPLDPTNSPPAQELDSSLFVQDNGDRSMINSQRLPSLSSLSASLPLGDTTHAFHYGRIFAEAVLREEETPQCFRCPVLLSFIRYHKEKAIQTVIANQDGSLNFAIQSDKTQGPTWADVKWHAREAMIEVCLPRRFFLCIYCSELDFGTFWRIYDYEKRTYAALSQRSDEDFVFETILKSFQQLDENSHPNFKEPQPFCHMRLFKKIVLEKAATGLRTMHRGFRIALVTSPTVKTLRGVDLDLLLNFPIEFSFLRGDDGFPALLLCVRDGKSKCMFIATFKETSERDRFHALLTGAALEYDEGNITEGSVKAVDFDIAKFQHDFPTLHTLDWQNFRFINKECSEPQGCKTVLSERLRVILEFGYGIMTDRINVGPGELKLRLDLARPYELKVHRQPQLDMTISIDSQAPKGLPQELAGLLQVIKNHGSIRVYTFPSLTELHLFQAALTGFEVLFDGVVTSFNISRRRMVVPIYKKWDAAMTRVQVIQKEKIVQLIAFFENFSHGDCMQFPLRSTDVFESSTRGGKYSLRIVDAKFSLPKSRTESSGVDHSFVCLDMPEYPGEHDDISIHFENESVLNNIQPTSAAVHDAPPSTLEPPPEATHHNPIFTATEELTIVLPNLDLD